MAGRMPTTGRMCLTPMLSPKGRLIGDFTLSRLGPRHFQLTASYAAQAFQMRWFEMNLPEDGSVQVENVSLSKIGFQIAGPQSRELLSRVTRDDVSNEVFPFMSLKNMEVGLCDATVLRVTYTGDLGYEIYVPVQQQLALYQALAEAGADLGLRPFGMRAMMSLRLEKSFGAWMREYRPDYTPVETGLDRFIFFNKPVDFIGKQAVAAAKAAGPTRKLCTFVVDADDADVHGDEPIFNGGKVVGFVTSGGYAHYVEKSVAIGFVPTDLIAEGQHVQIELLGELRDASLITEPLFDPRGERMRG